MRFLLALLLIGVPSLAFGGANLMPNSSFELGSSRGWKMTSSYTQLKDRILSTGGAQHGTYYAGNLGDSETLTSGQIWLTSGTQYTISFYAKASYTDNIYWQISPTTSASPNDPAANLVSATTSWSRISGQYTPTTSDYYSLNIFHIHGGRTLHIDAVMVEVGASASAYAPQGTIEAGLETAKERNTFFTADTKEFTVKYYNNGSSATISLLYKIYDVWNQEQGSGTLTPTLAAGASSATIALPAKNGFHRIVTRIATVDKSFDELTCVVLPFAAGSGADSTGKLGTHTEYDNISQTFLRKLGYKWTRTLSPSRAFRWTLVEPTDDGWVYPDAQVTALAGAGQVVLGTIHGGLDKYGGPDWAHNVDNSLKLDKWTNYVGTLVNRYKASVTHWELWNEPQQSGDGGTAQAIWISVPANYATMLTAACAVIKAEDPTAKIIAMGGVITTNWMGEAWDALSGTTKGQIDYVSTHMYPYDNAYDVATGDPNAAETDARIATFRTFGTDIGKPVWNTEAATWSYGGGLTENVAWGYYHQLYKFGTMILVEEWARNEAIARSRVSVDRITRNFARSMGNEFGKYFYYDNRFWTLQASSATTPYGWEYNGTPRPTIAALALANHFIGSFTSVTRPTNPNHAAVEIYVFELGSTRCAAVFNYDRLTRDIATAETSFTVYDVMGNAVTQPSGQIRVTRTPQYITTSLTAAQITTVLQGALTTISDTTGPRISVDVAPSGTWAGGEAFMRWSAFDDRDAVHHTPASNNKVEFAHQMDGAAYSAWGQITMLRTTLSAGNHTLWVKARDSAANVTELSYLFSPSTVPPTISSFNVNTDGVTGSIVFSETMAQGAGWSGSNFDIDGTTAGNNIVPTITGGTGTATWTWSISGAALLRSGTVDYDFNGTANAVEATSGGVDLAAVTSGSMVNNSQQPVSRTTGVVGGGRAGIP